MAAALRHRSKGLSFQATAEAFFEGGYFNVEAESVRKNVYKPFMDALREYSVIDHLVRHGRVLSSLLRKFGAGRTLQWPPG